MPTVSQQKAKKPEFKGCLSKIVPVGTLSKGLKLLAYGKGKTGKTRLFSTFKKPALLVGTEDGTNSIADVEDLDFFPLTASKDLDEVCEMLRSGYYKSVGLDTAGGLQDLIIKEVLNLDEIPITKSWGMARKQDWGAIGNQFKERVRNLIDLADGGVLDVMIIAHERNFNDEDDRAEIKPTIGAALTPGSAGWLNGACDYVCQTFLREGTEIHTQKVGDQEIKTERKTGKIEYCLRIGQHPVYITGFRVRSKLDDLPDHIVDPSYVKIMKLVQGD